MVPKPPAIEGPCHPTAKEYPAFLRFLSESYRFKDPRWFENDSAFFFGKRPDQLRGKWVLKSGNRFAAHVGIFPFTALVEGRALKVAGIGGVATHPDFRGQGLMKRLMDHVMEEVDKGGFDLSILWGERALYQPYGFERSLFLDQFTFLKRHLKYFAVPKGVRPARPADLPSFQRLYEDHPFQVERSGVYTASILRRFRQCLREPAWVLEEKGKVVAYAVFGKPWGGGLEAADWGGKSEDVACLFSTALQQIPDDLFTASLAPGSGLYSWALENCSDHIRTTRACMVKPLRLERILRAFEPQLQKRYREMGGNARNSYTLRMENGQGAGLKLGAKLQVIPPSSQGNALTLSNSDCVGLLFGINPPVGVRPLAQLFPLNWYWWRSDWI